MIRPIIRTAEDVDAATLNRFLHKVYSPEKAAFLEQHCVWWYRGQHNRWLIQENDEVVAYCAVIPTTMCVGEEEVEAAWWVDLVVDPAHRGKGYQRIFDERVRRIAPLIVGFPNAIAATIHRKHGWGVREDLEVRMLPLRPRKIARGRGSGMVGKVVMGLSATVVAPVAALMRRRLERFEPRFSRILTEADPRELAEVFSRHRDSVTTTTRRDEEYLAWRYLEAPYRDQLVFVAGGRGDIPQIVAVLRMLQKCGNQVARILDLFGALDDRDIVRDVLSFSARVAIERGVCQMTALCSHRSLSRLYRDVGFVARTPARICWKGADPQFGSLATKVQLVLGDSDNDEP